MQKVYLERLVPFERRKLDENTVDVLTITDYPCVIGRHKACDQPIEHDQISRRHCDLFLQGDQVFVEDLGSLNGTRLNGERLRSAQPVHDGDVLTLAGLSFEVHMAALPQSSVVKPEAFDPMMEHKGKPRRVFEPARFSKNS